MKTNLKHNNIINGISALAVVRPSDFAKSFAWYCMFPSFQQLGEIKNNEISKNVVAM